MNYLFWAYLIIWVLLAGYIYLLDTKQNKLAREIKELKMLLDNDK